MTYFALDYLDLIAYLWMPAFALVWLGGKAIWRARLGQPLWSRADNYDALRALSLCLLFFALGFNSLSLEIGDLWRQSVRLLVLLSSGLVAEWAATNEKAARKMGV